MILAIRVVQRVSALQYKIKSPLALIWLRRRPTDNLFSEYVHKTLSQKSREMHIVSLWCSKMHQINHRIQNARRQLSSLCMCAALAIVINKYTLQVVQGKNKYAIKKEAKCTHISLWWEGESLVDSCSVVFCTDGRASALCNKPPRPRRRDYKHSLTGGEGSYMLYAPCAYVLYVYKCARIMLCAA